MDEMMIRRPHQSSAGVIADRQGDDDMSALRAITEQPNSLQMCAPGG
jgi:hypothetical protein